MINHQIVNFQSKLTKQLIKTNKKMNLFKKIECNVSKLSVF